jgi:hypothetical protein
MTRECHLSAETPVTFAYDDLDGLQVGGQGLVTSGGGFVGGGFGQGALVGMGIASLLTA